MAARMSGNAGCAGQDTQSSPLQDSFFRLKEAEELRQLVHAQLASFVEADQKVDFQHQIAARTT
jgi:hypothetical protein